MKSWLTEHLEKLPLTEDLQGYLYGRGVTERDIHSFGMKEWDVLSENCPEPTFYKYGKDGRGENLRRYLCTPIYSPRGKILGAEFRSYKGPKSILQYRLPEAEWQANWIALKGVTAQIYAGGDPWIFEGLFDLAPMRQVLPNSPLLGTIRARLSDEHVEYLRRYLRPGAVVNIAYDNDETGRKASFFAVKNLEKVGIRAIERKYTGGKDPGKVWDNFGVDGLREAFDL